MIIVEGPDCVGKTALCKKLLERLPDHRYQHLGRLPDSFDRYWDYVKLSHPLVIQDRFHISEVIYAAVRGDVTSLDHETYRLVDAHTRTLGGFTILITADKRLIKQRWTSDQMYSLSMTLDAGRRFEEVDTEMMDIDYWFHCNLGVPYVTDSTIDEILEQYRIRRAVITNIRAREPIEG